jgi:hypothetical protein
MRLPKWTSNDHFSPHRCDTVVVDASALRRDLTADPTHPYTAPVTENADVDHSEPIAVASFATLGEAEVAQAKLRAFGIEAALDDRIEGGTVLVDDEPGVIVTVRAADAVDARLILTDTDADTDTDTDTERTDG